MWCRACGASCVLVGMRQAVLPVWKHRGQAGLVHVPAVAFAVCLYLMGDAVFTPGLLLGGQAFVIWLSKTHSDRLKFVFFFFSGSN